MITRHFSGSKNVTITIPDNEIWYTSTDGNVVIPSTSGFNANIISNNYETGVGVITFDGPVYYIEAYAFANCTSLESVQFCNSLVSISEFAFSNCPSLTSITIPASVVTIGPKSFSNNNLSTVTYSAKKATTYRYGGGGIYYYGMFNGSSSDYDPNDTITNFVFTEGVEFIPDGLCMELTGLVSVTLPSTLTDIGQKSFWRCSNLKTLYCKSIIPPTVKDWYYFENLFDVIYVPRESLDLYKNQWAHYANKIQPIS